MVDKKYTEFVIPKEFSEEQKKLIEKQLDKFILNMESFFKNSPLFCACEVQSVFIKIKERGASE